MNKSKTQGLKVEPNARHSNELAQMDRSNLDSGYAWLILVVMFLLNSTISGSSRVYGIVYAKQVAIGYYDRAEASWPIATASAIENLAGLLTPALAQSLSWRQIELLASSLFVLSNLGAYFSDSLPLDIICLGLIQGIALSMNTVLSLAINNDYFERYRTTAYGIAMSGSTFGVLYLNPLVAWLLEVYPDNFRIVYLALSLVFCMNILLVLFIKPRKRSQEELILMNINNNEARLGLQSQASSNSIAPPTTPTNQRKVSLLSYHLERKTSVASISYECRVRRQSAWSRQSNFNLIANGSVRAPSKRPSVESTDGAGRPLGLASSNPVGLASGASISTKVIVPIPVQTKLTSSPPSQAPLNLPKNSSVVSFGPQADLEASSYTASNHVDKQTINADYYNKSGSSSSHTKSSDEAQFSLDSILNLLKLPYLHFVWLMLALYYLIARIFLIILVDFADDHGMSEDEARNLLNYWSLGELLGRVFLGSLIDLHWLNVKSCITLTCSLLGALILSLALVQGHYFVYAACSILVAAFISLEYMLINVLMIEYIGKHRVTSCYSLAAFISSLVLFGRPSLIGLFRDQLGSYDGLLLLLAVLALSFGLAFAMLEPILVRFWPKAGQL